MKANEMTTRTLLACGAVGAARAGHPTMIIVRIGLRRFMATRLAVRRGEAGQEMRVNERRLAAIVRARDRIAGH